MEPHVRDYTGLELESARPPAELLTRAGWAEVNLVSLAHILDPVAARLEDRLDFAGPLAGALRAGASATLAAEVGLVTGYLAHRVLGQYDVSLLAATSRRGCSSSGRTSTRRSPTSTSTPTRSGAGCAPTS